MNTSTNHARNYTHNNKKDNATNIHEHRKSCVKMTLRLALRAHHEALQTGLVLIGVVEPSSFRFRVAGLGSVS